MNHFPIKTISEFSSLSAMTLHARERRSGLLKSTGKPCRYRLYSVKGIDLVRESEKNRIKHVSLCPQIKL